MEILHYICHWMEAGKKQKEVNFGLSSNPDDKETVKRDERVDLLERGMRATIEAVIKDYNIMARGMR